MITFQDPAGLLSDTGLVYAKMRGQPFSEIPVNQICVGDAYLGSIKCASGETLEFVWCVVNVEETYRRLDRGCFSVTATTLLPKRDLMMSLLDDRSKRDDMIYIGRLEVRPPDAVASGARPPRSIWQRIKRLFVTG